MSIRQIPQRDADELKRACGGLVEKAGGVAEAARLTQTTPSRLSEAVSPFHDNRWLSVMHVADLECVAGQPMVTAALAAMAGYGLVPLERGRPQDMHLHLTHVIRECGDVSSGLSAALADGSLDEAERRALRAEVAQALDRLQALQADLAEPRVVPLPVRGGGGA